MQLAERHYSVVGETISLPTMLKLLAVLGGLTGSAFAVLQAWEQRNPAEPEVDPVTGDPVNRTQKSSDALAYLIKYAEND